MKNSLILFSLLLIFSSIYAKETIVYISVNGGSKIDSYKLDTNAKKLVSLASVNTNGKPFALEVSHNNKYLFASILDTKKATSYKIDSKDGSLMLINSIPIADGACHLGITANNKYLLSAYFGAHKVAIYPIEEDGVLNADATQIEFVTKWPHMMQVNPKGNVVYVPNMGADLIKQYAFNQETGMISPLSPKEIKTSVNSGPRHLTFHPSLDVVYFSLEKSSQTISCKHGDNGLENPFQTIENLPANYASQKWTSDIHLTPNGKFLFTANRVKATDSDRGTFTCFSIDQTSGKLTLVDRFETEKTVREFDIDPSGKFLIAAGENSGKVILYEIGDNGGLKKVDEVNLGNTLWWVKSIEIEGLSAHINPNDAEQEGMNVYPNPFHDKFTVSLDTRSSQSCEVSIIDALGKTVIQKSVLLRNEPLFFDLSTQPLGVYHVIIKLDGKTISSKILSI